MMTPEKRKNVLMWFGAVILTGAVCYMQAWYSDTGSGDSTGSLTLSEYERNSLRSLGRKAGGGAEGEDDFPAQKQFDSLPALLLALNSNRIRSIYTFRSAADYLVKRNPGLGMTVDETLHYYFKMGVGPDDKALNDRINAGLRELRESGTLDALVREWITSPRSDAPPKIRPVEKRTDAVETLRFGVTGDCPPLDYTAPDGTPAGFNVALLAELAKVMNVNISIVPVALEARAVALSSGRIDVIFWIGSFNDAYVDTGKKRILTSDKYFDEPGATVTKKSSKVKISIQR